MTMYLVALVVFALLSLVMACYFADGYSGPSFIAHMFGVFGCIVSLVGLVILAVMGVSWTGASHQAAIINREYGTNYTQAEVFYASSVIDTVRELQRRRVEVNGDVFRDQADPSVQARREKSK